MFDHSRLGADIGGTAQVTIGTDGSVLVQEDRTVRRLADHIVGQLDAVRSEDAIANLREPAGTQMMVQVWSEQFHVAANNIMGVIEQHRADSVGRKWAARVRRGRKVLSPFDQTCIDGSGQPSFRLDRFGRKTRKNSRDHSAVAERDKRFVFGRELPQLAQCLSRRRQPGIQTGPGLLEAVDRPTGIKGREPREVEAFDVRQMASDD